MAKHLRIAISSPDDRGILAAVTGRIFELGGDLGDATFAVLGEAAEMTCVCTFDDGIDEAVVQSAIAGRIAVDRGQTGVMYHAARLTRANG